ncbi:MAG: NAD-dependent succinate-semialdehyde dehydrogenase, partial [Candidatus Eremiobacteraeota bacterium]|nr:NAD-dependent succinate-semialdehyde dehydrogenase [Candidatus Eremiobacteraeota bacterium]
RGDLLRSLAKLLRRDERQLAEIAVREMGKPIVQAKAEIEKCARTCEYFAQNGAKMLEEIAVKSGASKSYVAFRPLGVLFAIMPWNFPYWQVIRAIAPALMAGNTVALKHSDNTTQCGLELERLVAEASAREDLFAAVLISGSEADDLIEDPRIAAVTLTGSERAGTAVATAAGKVLKKCVLELGGSDAFIVLRDADLDLAVDFAVKARFQNNGQSCIAAKRFIVEEPLYVRFVDRFSEAAARQIVGSPMEERTQIGPCAREDLREALYRQIRQSVVDGARIVTGGHPVSDAPGYFFQPTVVADVAPSMAMFEEETFGPAAAVIKAEDEDTAIALANRSNFGLGANLWTRDTDRAQRIAAQIEAGSVFINGMVASDPRLPFGGVKRSGYGRELSEFGIREFVNIQTVWIGPDSEKVIAAE